MELTHIPVLAQEVIEFLDPKKGETVLDVTLGLGGHSELFSEKIGSTGKLFCIDADRENLSRAKERLQNSSASITFHHSNFSKVGDLHLPECDIIFADLGLSSPHLDDTSRGFAFREDAPLDMRFDRTQGQTAAEFLASLSEEQTADVLWNFGEIRESRRIAKQIKLQNPQTTFALKKCVEDACGWKAKSVLAQVFQAIRIAVNQELHVLSKFLESAITLLSSKGRLGVISYHSLEDRMVKQFFKTLTTPEKDPVTGAQLETPLFELRVKKAIKPSEHEQKLNPRSRSARLRILHRSS